MTSSVCAATKAKIQPAIKVILWSFVMSALSCVEIPLGPVPITLQTVGVYLIGLFLSPKQAFAATTLYLVQVSIGLPFMSGGISHAVWYFGTCAGYLYSFPFAAYIIARYRSIAGLALGECFILLVGSCWLAFFIGFLKAFIYGFLIFIPTSIVKIGATFAVARRWKGERSTN